MLSCRPIERLLTNTWQIMDNEISQNTTPAAEQDQSMSPSMESPDRVSTGIPGLDTVLNGGLRSQRSYLVRGPPGNGRTALGLQFLSGGIVQLNTPSTERTVEIVKLRGSDTDMGRTRYRSRLAASRCFHSSSPTASPPPEETLTSGVPEVDELLRRGVGGWLARGTTTMITGPSALTPPFGEFIGTVRQDIETKDASVVMIDGIPGFQQLGGGPSNALAQLGTLVEVQRPRDCGARHRRDHRRGLGAVRALAGPQRPRNDTHGIALRDAQSRGVPPWRPDRHGQTHAESRTQGVDSRVIGGRHGRMIASTGCVYHQMDPSVGRSGSAPVSSHPSSGICL